MTHSFCSDSFNKLTGFDSTNSSIEGAVGEGQDDSRDGALGR